MNTCVFRRFSGGATRLSATLSIACTLSSAVHRVAADEAKPDAEKPLVLKAAVVHSMQPDTKPIESATIVIENGKIVAVGAGISTPDGATVRELEGAQITPGLIDANCALAPESLQRGWRRFDGSTPTVPAFSRDFRSHNITPPPAPSPTIWTDLAADSADLASHSHDDDDVCSEICGGVAKPNRFITHIRRAPLARGVAESGEPTSVSEGSFALTSEESAEVVPHTRVADSLNLYAKDFRRLARTGVTTVFAAADTSATIGAAGAIVKTGGPIRARMVNADDAVQAAMGSDSFSRGNGNDLPPLNGPEPSPVTRRPTTRMGVDWVVRKAFYDAKLAATGRTPHGADTPPAPAWPILQEILSGKRPLRMQARMRHDIESAIRIAKEFGLKFTLVEAIEAYNALPALKSAGASVIFGPIYMDPAGWRAIVGRGFGTPGEGGRARLSTAKQLQNSGLPWALTANDLRDEQGLAAQAMFAAANGLTPAQAMHAVTRAPAEMLGIADRCGSIAAGLDADLVAWSGPPTDPTSKVLLVIINGQVVHDAMDK